LWVLAGRAQLIASGAISGVLLPLCLSPPDVGLFFLSQSLIAGAAVIAQFGLTFSVVALIPQALALQEFGRAASIIRRSIAVTTIAGLIVAALLWCGLDSAGGSELSLALQKVAHLIAVVVPIAALQAVIAEEFRGLHAIGPASLLGGAASGLLMSVILSSLWLCGVRLSLEDALIVNIAALAIPTMAGLAGLFGTVCRWPNTSANPYSWTDLWRFSLPNLVTSLCLFILSQADLWIVGLMASTRDVAFYGVGVRLASLIVIPLAIVNGVAGPAFGALWTRKKRRYLQRLLGSTATAATTLSAAGYLLFLLIGAHGIAMVWGADYLPSYELAAILGAAQLMHVVAGSSGYVLIVLGHQRSAMYITLATGLLTIGSTLVGMRHAGVVGVAVGSGLGLVLQTCCLWWATRRHLGLDARATGNLMDSARFLRSAGFRVT
jgi:O-antigen/teichoic acid export membrane protein